MSKATKSVKQTTQTVQASVAKVEEPLTETVSKKAVKSVKKEEVQPVVEQPVQAQVEHEEHEEEHEEKKKRVVEFETSELAREERNKIITEMTRLSKRLTYVTREEDRLRSKESRLNRNRRDKTSKTGSKSGFNKPQAIPEHIRNFLNSSCKEDFRVAADDLKPRTWITKAIYSYIHDNKLTAEDSGRKIIANDKLADLFGVDSGSVITFESFQTMVSNAFKIGNEAEQSGSGDDSNEEVVEVKKAPVKVASK